MWFKKLSFLIFLICACLFSLNILAAQPSEEILGNVRVQLLSDTLVRIELKGQKGFEDRPSFTVVGRDNWDAVEYTVTESEGYAVIATDAYSVYIPDGASSLSGCYIIDVGGEILWQYSANTTSNVYLPSPSDKLDSWFFTDSPRIIPSAAGYSLTDPYEEFNGWDMDNDSTDAFVFLPKGDYKTFTEDFVKLTGRSELITPKLLGYWDSRYYAYTAETALQQIKDYQDKGYSIDVLVIDTDWREIGETGGVGYEINEELFPDMAAFLEEAHALGVDIVFNDHPEPVSGTDNLLDEEEVAYRSEKLKLILSLGLDYWWYDRNWSVSLNPIHKDLSIYATGMYAFDFVTEEYYNSITDLGEYARRALIMGNVDGIKNGSLTYAPELASHRYTLQWTGDVGVWEEDIADEIFNAVYGGVKLGLPYVSADIGGHMEGKLMDDLYVRWMQFGALSPIMRVHCGKNMVRMPWCFGETAESVTHTYVDMRYRLIPLYYALAHENYETGLPLVRRLDVNYPQYAESAANDQYLLGDSILVAPIAEGLVPTEDYTLSLTAEYFPNQTLSGTPTVIEQVDTPAFDVGTGTHPSIGKSSDFSIRYSGTITVGKNDIVLRFFADDGIRIYIDGEEIANLWDVYDVYFTSEPLLAGTTHSITIEYFEDVNNAHLKMWVYGEAKNERTVFIPDGEWMDVWTGETFVGPTTVSVAHSLTTSPVFVRMGSVIALADVVQNMDESDWSHLTLDVYPSVTNSAEFTLYEDDGETVAYKDGHFRTTEISVSGEGQTVTLAVDAAKGSFEGDFAERKWTVRMHAREDFGALTAMTVNGAPVSFETVQKDADAAPFAVSGGARDNTVYEYTFTSPIAKENTVIFTFASASEDGVNENYDAVAATTNVTVEKLVKASAADNISEIGNKDWVYFGALGKETVIRKNVKSHMIGDLSILGSYGGLSDSFELCWQDGDLRKIGTSKKGVYTKAEFELPLSVDSETTQYQLFLGGWKSIAKLTVRDRAGNVQTYTFGDMTTNYYYKITIDCSAAQDSEIYISYSVLSGENVTVTAVAASDGNRVELPNVDFAAGAVPITVSTPHTDTVDLTALGNLDWEFYGKLNSKDTVQFYRKSGNQDYINTVFSSEKLHYDNKAAIVWSDGDTVTEAKTLSGTNTNGTVKVTLNTKGVDTVTMLVGAWKGKNTMTLYDSYGLLLADAKVVVQNDTTAQMALVTLDFSDYTLDSATVEFAFSGSGNISVNAIAVGGTTTDFDSDGKVTLVDAMILLKAVVNEKPIGYGDTPPTLLDVLRLMKSIAR